MSIKNLQFSLPISIVKEGHTFVAHTSALDISTCADSIKEVKDRFIELVEIFFEELEKKGTTDEVLESMGWQKIQSSWEPPVEVEHTIEEFKVRAV
ncbi:MAG TPA: hypothetical protein VJI96_04205 [Candidatus Andersenbacteria bacterium]|nr:hypothetical protein [Candidatus Andersenbacteria bacterium]